MIATQFEFQMNSRLDLRRSAFIIPTSERDVLVTRRDGTGFRLTDADAPVLEMLEMLQRGTIYRAFMQRFAGGAAGGRARKLLEDLVTAEVLSAPAPASGFTDVELERFDRLLGYFGECEQTGISRFDFLRRLRQAHVLVVGIGGMGSWLLLHLIANGVGRITVVDGDVVEQSNLARQAFYQEADVGRKKVATAIDAAARLTTLTEVRGIDRTIGSAADVAEILQQGQDIRMVLLTADRPIWQIILWTAEAANRAGIPMLRGSLSGVGPLAIPGTTACPACAWPRALAEPGAERFLDYRWSNRAPSNANAAVISTDLAMVAAIFAHEAIAFLSGCATVETYDAQIGGGCSIGPIVERTPVTRSSDCPICATAADPARATPAPARATEHA